jgi:hypothetical protein
LSASGFIRKTEMFKTRNGRETPGPFGGAELGRPRRESRWRWKKRKGEGGGARVGQAAWASVAMRPCMHGVHDTSRSSPSWTLGSCEADGKGRASRQGASQRRWRRLGRVAASGGGRPARPDAPRASAAAPPDGPMLAVPSGPSSTAACSGDPGQWERAR